jgi:hypothetical protein
MEVTHQEARSLIQFRADQALNEDKMEMLAVHLKDCGECADYADEIQETELTLRTTLRKHWNVRPLPLEMKDIKAKLLPISWLNDLLTTRKALIGIMLLFFVFGFWQISSTRYNSSSRIVGMSPIPTPSFLMTSTQNNFATCQKVRYEVHQNDSLESIARRFLVSKEAILIINNLQPNAATLPTELIIPLCESTPTGTTHPPASTTNTPSLEFISYTPG